MFDRKLTTNKTHDTNTGVWMASATGNGLHVSINIFRKPFVTRGKAFWNFYLVRTTSGIYGRKLSLPDATFIFALKHRHTCSVSSLTPRTPETGYAIFFSGLRLDIVKYI